MVGAGIAAGLLCCAVAAAGDASWGHRGGAGSLMSVPLSSADMQGVAWKALHSEFQREDAELQAQLGIAQLPALKDISSGVSNDVMSSAMGDSSIAGRGMANSRMGAAKLRIMRRYGEKGESMDNDMGFSGGAGPYSALLQTSAVVGDPTSAGSARILPILFETDGESDTTYADAMSANGLPANDARWPARAAKSAESSLASEAAKAAEQLLKSQMKARALASARREQARERLINKQAHEQEIKLAQVAAEKAEKNNIIMQREQEKQDADSDGHELSSRGAGEYDSHYTSLLSTGEGVNLDSSWVDPSVPGEDQRPRHQRLAYNDAIQHWAGARNRAGLSPNQPRSSSTPLGIPTMRIAPLRAALQERVEDAAAAQQMQQARTALEAHRERQRAAQEGYARLREEQRAGLQVSADDNTAAYASDDSSNANTQQLTFGTGGIGPGEEQGNDLDWRVAMEVDPNCPDMLADMAAGSLGALMHGSDDW